MASILLAYTSDEGQTAKVARRVAAVLDEQGHDPTTVDLASNGHLAVEDYDAVLVGASIHAGKHQSSAVDFARERRDELAARPGGFFQVCLSAASDDEERRAETVTYLDNFVAQTGWKPTRTATFAGALRYSEYGFLKRLMMKRIAGQATGDTDTSRDYEYTDWEQVETFAREFADLVEEVHAEQGTETGPPASD